MTNDPETRLLEGFTADHGRDSLAVKLLCGRGKGTASLRPSSFVKLLIDEDCPDPSNMDIRITSKSSVRNFSEGLRLVTDELGWAFTYLSQKLTWQVMKDAEASSVIKKLQDLSKLGGRLRLYLDDCRIDSFLEPRETFSPGQLDNKYVTIRVLNEDVKEKLQGQAMVCGIPAGLYVQVCMVKKLLEHYGSNASSTFGETAEAWRKTVDRFHDWLQFRVEYLEFAISRLSNTEEPAVPETDYADNMAATLALLVEQTTDGSTVTRQSLASRAIATNNPQLAIFIFRLPDVRFAELGYLVDESGEITAANTE